MKKWILCLLILLVAPALALADARMPVQRGTVTDDADILSAQTAADVTAFAERVKDETDIALHAAAVHFLDGLDVQTYANQLFEKWELGENDMLLLVAAGEDSAATAMGRDVEKQLGQANAENLMYTSSSFQTLLRTQQYDEAFAAYYTALNTLLEKQTGESLIGKLFGTQPAPETTVQDFGSELWGEVMEAIQDSSSDYQAYHAQHEKQDNGITAGGWIVLVILAFIVLRQKRSRRRGRNGCGCSPLGWIFSLLGLNFLVDFFRKD